MQIAGELMKFKIALIPSKHISKAQDLSAKLRNAIEAGEMGDVDQLTEELTSLADNGYSLFLPEEYWHQLIGKVRIFDDDFKSDFILARPQLKTIIATDVTESFSKISDILEQALMADGAVLQLPFEEEDADV